MFDPAYLAVAIRPDTFFKIGPGHTVAEMQTLYTGIVQSKIQAFISLVFVISWNKIKDKGKVVSFLFCFNSSFSRQGNQVSFSNVSQLWGGLKGNNIKA